MVSSVCVKSVSGHVGVCVGGAAYVVSGCDSAEKALRVEQTPVVVLTDRQTDRETDGMITHVPVCGAHSLADRSDLSLADVGVDQAKGSITNPTHT